MREECKSINLVKKVVHLWTLLCNCITAIANANIPEL